MESLMFLPDFTKTTNAEQHTGKELGSSEVPQLHSAKQGRETAEKESESDVEVENVERPVDLYKAIFSDDSEDEENAVASEQVQDLQKKIEAANTALNRLMAGDFLESLGKELGLAVPLEAPLSENKVGARAAQKESNNIDKSNANPLLVDKEFSASHNIVVVLQMEKHLKIYLVIN